MILVLLGFLWFCIALLATYFIVVSSVNSVKMVRAGIALILVSFLAGLIILYGVIVYG